MRKEGKKQFEEVDLSKQKVSLNESEEQFIIKNGDEYPNRLIGHLKIRIEVESQDENFIKTGQIKQEHNCKGSGCMIADGYFLTAAHNLKKANEVAYRLDKNKASWKNTSYVRQGLGLKKQGDQNYIAQFQILDNFINPLYGKDIEQTQQLKKQAERIAKQESNSKEGKIIKMQDKVKKLKEQMKDMQDFAILKVKPLSQPIKQKYMPIVVLSEQTFKKMIADISIFGYPVGFNQAKSPDEQKSSVYINNLCGNISSWKSYERNCLNYDLITEEGISGAPIIAKFGDKSVIIAIHKGGKRDKQSYNVKQATLKKEAVSEKQSQNIGVGAGQMIEVLNEYGYTQQKGPFVFTQKTLYLHEQDTDIQSREIIFLMDKGFGPFDILVYTSFNLSNVQKILLSGNEIGDKGVEFLLRRKYPKLHALFLTQNKIASLANIPEENWKNIESVITLGLSVNELAEIPVGFLHLKKLQKLWLNHNHIKEVSPNLVNLCKQINRESFTVYLHTNNINLANQKKELIEELKQLKTRIVWEKQGVNA